MYWTELLYIKVDQNDDSLTIDSVGLNSFRSYLSSNRIKNITRGVFFNNKRLRFM